MVLGMRDYSHHISTVRETFDRVRVKGYHVIDREFDEGGERSYHPPSNDDAIGWATRLRNKNIAPSAEEMNLLKAFAKNRRLRLRLLSIAGVGRRCSGRDDSAEALQVQRRGCSLGRGRNLQSRNLW